MGVSTQGAEPGQAVQARAGRSLEKGLPCGERTWPSQKWAPRGSGDCLVLLR